MVKQRSGDAVVNVVPVARQSRGVTEPAGEKLTEGFVDEGKRFELWLLDDEILFFVAIS